MTRTPPRALPSLALAVALLAALAPVACGKDDAEDAADALVPEVSFEPAPDSKACGPSGTYAARVVPEKWVGVCGARRVDVRFSEACVAHDACYDTLGSERAACDGAFQGALEARCETTYAAGACVESRRLCRRVAREYADRVRAGGEDAWRRAQEAARATPTPAASTPTPVPSP